MTWLHVLGPRGGGASVCGRGEDIQLRPAAHPAGSIPLRSLLYIRISFFFLVLHRSKESCDQAPPLFDHSIYIYISHMHYRGSMRM